MEAFETVAILWAFPSGQGQSIYDLVQGSQTYGPWVGSSSWSHIVLLTEGWEFGSGARRDRAHLQNLGTGAPLGTLDGGWGR